MNVKLFRFDQVPLPIFKEVKGKDWVYYGEKNDYPEYLLRLYNNSAKHNAIITGKVDYTCGAGWEAKSDSLIDQAKGYSIIEKVNRSQESLNELTNKLCTDLYVFGGYYLQIVWSKGTGEVAELYHLDYSKMRSNKDCTEYYYSDEWIKNGNTNTRPEYQTYPAFDPNNRTGTQVLYYKQYRAGLKTYSMPDYRGAINYIELDISISEYHLNSINNGMFSSKLINFNNGIVSEEEESRIEKMVNNKFAGSKNAGKIMISFNDGSDKAPTILDLSGTELDKHFDLLNKTVQQEIFSGHKVTSGMLFGIKTEGQLGGRNEIRESFELFKNTYIDPKQKEVESIINYLYSFNDIVAYLCLKDAEPIKFEFTEGIISQNLTQDEIRDMLSLPKIEKSESEKGQSIINAINSLPQPLAQKVIDTLTPEEARLLIGLPPVTTPNLTEGEVPLEEENPCWDGYEPIGVKDKDGKMVPNCVPIKSSKQISDEEIWNAFQGFGVAKDKYNVIDTKMVFGADDIVVAEFEEIKLTNLQQLIIEKIKENPLMTKTEISEIAKVPISVIDENIKALVEVGALNEKTIKKNGAEYIERKVSKDINKILKDMQPITQYKVLYSYEQRPNVPPAISGSRPLCRRLYGSNLFFTRQEIESISSQLGYSVFLLCGGWYTNPDTQVTTPYCRHFWQRNIVVEK